MDTRAKSLNGAVCYINGFLFTSIFNNNNISQSTTLRHIDFNKHKYAISYINVENRHWMLVYIDAVNGTVFVVDPIKSDELKYVMILLFCCYSMTTVDTFNN